MAAVRQAGAQEGQRLVDLGAGFGFFAFAASAIVGPSGLVYAVEPDPSRCGAMERRAASEGVGNVRVLKTGAEQLGEVPTGSIDLAFSAFTLHHFADKKAALSEIQRVLKTGGSFYAWDRVPGILIRHGSRREDLEELAPGFAKFEVLSSGRTIKARYVK
jgi:ubiquinone/menaquinone biosynthesis C-methylase UbiE